MLTGKYRTGTPSDSRAASEHFTDFVRPFIDERSRHIVDAVMTAASGLGVAPLEVALAWVRDRPGVTAAIVGARTAAQLLGSLGAGGARAARGDRHRARRGVDVRPAATPSTAGTRRRSLPSEEL